MIDADYLIAGNYLIDALGVARTMARVPLTTATDAPSPSLPAGA